jgi:hypothetical protein
VKHIRLLITILLISTSYYSFSQTADTVQISAPLKDTLLQNHPSGFEEHTDDDFSPALFLIVVAGIGFILLSVGAGIVLTVIALLMLFGLIGAGIVSTSVMIGLYTKSFEKGFKTFMVSAITICGIFASTIIFWLFNKIVHWFSTSTSLIIGSIVGLISGFLLGFTLFYVIQKLTSFLKNKLTGT